MPDISSYKINTAPDPSDILIGTDVTNGQTKNFSIQFFKAYDLAVYNTRSRPRPKARWYYIF
jgi:hypothetical protein